MDDYPAAEPIPDPTARERVNFQHEELMRFLVNNDEMRKAAKNSLKQGMFAGGGAVAGGLLLGPIGGLIGGVVGSVVGFLQSDPYDGVIQQVLVLEEAPKRRLVLQVGQILQNAGATAQQFETAEAFRATLRDFAAQRTVRDQVWHACVDALS